MARQTPGSDYNKFDKVYPESIHFRKACSVYLKKQPVSSSFFMLSPRLKCCSKIFSTDLYFGIHFPNIFFPNISLNSKNRVMTQDQTNHWSNFEKNKLIWSTMGGLGKIFSDSMEIPVKGIAFIPTIGKKYMKQTDPK